MISKDREYRNFQDINLQEDSKTVSGLAVVFNSPTVLYEIGGKEYREVVDPGAFDGVDLSDVVLNVDHEGKPAAKTKNQTLRLEVRPEGLFMEADLSKNQTGRELYEDIRNGFYDKMSYAYSVEADEYNRETRTRTLKKVKRLYDVSAVTFPAYSQTNLQARSFFEAEAERERVALENAEKRRRLSAQITEILEGKTNA